VRYDYAYRAVPMNLDQTNGNVRYMFGNLCELPAGGQRLAGGQ
jgi:hypothetical protein